LAPERGVIETARLILVPATVALARAELEDRGRFAELLAASVPAEWPPATLADALPVFLEWLESDPDARGWFGWYALAGAAAAAALAPGAPARVLVGSGGFKGRPREGTAEIGYAVLPRFQGSGYATELVEALLSWAFAQPGVVRIVAQTEWANPASVRVLRKAGFSQVDRQTGRDAAARFEISR
jgi:RimJ/RimL family protein N-acetyltransferase